VTTKWLLALVRARQVQEDVAQRELAQAERRARRATAFARHNAERIEALSAEEIELTVPAFVAAAVALQAAAATHAAAIASEAHAFADSAERRVELRHAARARFIAEDMHDQVRSVEAARHASAEQREHDEVAATVHRRNELAAAVDRRLNAETP
jgi:hypothetical protein